MAHKKRNLSAFSLSFLDIMSCGFGAVILLFLIAKHNVDTNTLTTQAKIDLSSEVLLLEEEILEGKDSLVHLRNSISEIDDSTATAQWLARKIMDDIGETAGKIEALPADQYNTDIDRIKEDIKKMGQDKQRLEAETEEIGKDSRSFVGEGNREYLTGLKLGGKHILLLLDVSASMLDESIVNIIRRRNMSDEHKRNSAKWQRVIKIVDWLTAKFPVNSNYQLYTFNTETQPILRNTTGKWLKVSNKEELDSITRELEFLIPSGGTSLEKAFVKGMGLSPKPDNIYLITDGLPTQDDRSPRGTTISGSDRLKLFERAYKKLPVGIPVNVILEPMEGDPMAASAFWRLAQITEGSFMSPTEDWP